MGWEGAGLSGPWQHGEARLLLSQSKQALCQPRQALEVRACRPAGTRHCPLKSAARLLNLGRRFPGRAHHVWLEPEGLETEVVYPNGISNSMEPEDQLRLLATIPGDRMLRNACVGIQV